MYQVVDTTTKRAVATGFSSREAAKKIRNKRNGGKEEGIHIVSRGKNHPRGPSYGPVDRSKRWL